jgi:hypothetical protein
MPCPLALFWEVVATTVPPRSPWQSSFVNIFSGDITCPKIGEALATIRETKPYNLQKLVGQKQSKA